MGEYDGLVIGLLGLAFFALLGLAFFTFSKPVAEPAMEVFNLERDSQGRLTGVVLSRR